MNTLDITNMSDAGLDALLSNAADGLSEAASAAAAAEIMAPGFAGDMDVYYTRLTYGDLRDALNAAASAVEDRNWVADWKVEVEDNWREANGIATVHR